MKWYQDPDPITGTYKSNDTLNTFYFTVMDYWVREAMSEPCSMALHLTPNSTIAASFNKFIQPTDIPEKKPVNLFSLH